MRKVLTAAVIFGALFTAGCGNENANFKKALYYTDTGRYRDALRMYSAVIKENPKNFGAYTNRGMVYETLASKDFKNRREHLANAERDYTKAIDINPNSPAALNNLGAFYIDQKQFYNAVILLSSAIKISPNYYTALVNRGIAYYNAGEGIKAYNDFHKAIGLNPQGWLAYFNRGLYYYDTEHYLDAALDFTRTINYRPNYSRAYLERGRALKMNAMYADALQDFETAVALDPTSPLAHFYLGEMLFKDAQYTEALSELTKAKELDPGFAPTYELMGDILAVEDPTAAAANYILAKQLDPDNRRRYDAKISAMLSDRGRRRIAESRFF